MCGIHIQKNLFFFVYIMHLIPHNPFICPNDSFSLAQIFIHLKTISVNAPNIHFNPGANCSFLHSCFHSLLLKICIEIWPASLCLMDMSCLGKDSILANIQSHFQSCCVCWDRSKTFSFFPTIHISKNHTTQWEHVASGNSIEHSQDNLPMLPNLAYMYVQDTKHQSHNHFQRFTYGCTCHLQVPQHIQNPLKKWQPELQHSYETLSKFASSLLPAFGIYMPTR